MKDTDQIPEYVIQKLRTNPKYIWLTIDKAANKGRAIDTDLTNPLTYRVMTGSTSGGPINILKGINDFAIGTDGGGSVLAPAMSCQLPAIIGAGLDLRVKNKKLSTDGLDFVASIGVIGKRISVLKEVIECLIEKKLKSASNKDLLLIIPKRNSVVCPDQIDMHQKLNEYLSEINLSRYQIEEVNMSGIENRKRGIEVIEHCFNERNADLIITFEGPIDVYGYGETIPTRFGKVGKELTKNHGKYLVRAANVCNKTAVTVPTSVIASGILIIAKKGIEHCVYALELAQQLEDVIELPEVWKRYYLNESTIDTGLNFI